MNLVLLSGGSGSRLWPLSNDIRSKQFVKFFKNGNNMESMLQRVYHQISSVDREGKVVITTLKEQVSAIQNQIGENIKICIEPCRRDTFPAIVLAAAYLYDIEKVMLDEPIVVCPVDPFVEEEYFETLKKAAILSAKGTAELTLVGIEPTYPSEKYGYIVPALKQDVAPVKAFKEKPDIIAAQNYISQGALWNSGVFAFKLGYLLERAHKIIEFSDYYDLYNKYNMLEKISFDYAIVEKTKNIQVIRFSGNWKDVGTWNTLKEVMEEQCTGNVIMDELCENTHVINELDVPVLCMGLKNIVVASSPQGLLVTDKERSGYIKKYVDKINQIVMFSEKSWGIFQILDITDNSITVKVVLKVGKYMSYHSHEKRKEVWIIISGKGETIIDEKRQKIGVGDVIRINTGIKHTVIAKTELKIIEIQLGKEISAYDKMVYDFKI